MARCVACVTCWAGLVPPLPVHLSSGALARTWTVGVPRACSGSHAPVLAACGRNSGHIAVCALWVAQGGRAGCACLWWLLRLRQCARRVAVKIGFACASLTAACPLPRHPLPLPMLVQSTSVSSPAHSLGWLTAPRRRTSAEACTCGNRLPGTARTTPAETGLAPCRTAIGPPSRAASA